MRNGADLLIYNLIYLALSGDGRDALFGKRLENDCDVFMKSFAGNDFPEIWYEVPMIGEPWYDLHVLTSKNALKDPKDIPEGIFHQKLFEWFMNNDGVRQLAMSHDLSKGVYDFPAAQLLVGVRDDSVGCSFLDAAGNHSAASAYTAFEERIPEGWFSCYLGTFPERRDLNLRVECIPDYSDIKAYSSDEKALENDLAKAGFEPDKEILKYIKEMISLPFEPEFQFNVEKGGNAAPILGVSIRFLRPGGMNPGMCFDPENKELKTFMGTLKGAGLCDERWRLLNGCAFLKRLSAGDMALRFGGYPAFIKVRMTPERLLDAKAYIVARSFPVC